MGEWRECEFAPKENQAPEWRRCNLGWHPMRETCATCPVPALVAAVRAGLQVLQRIPSADCIEDVIADGGAAYGHSLAVAMSRMMEVMTAALAAVTKAKTDGKEPNR